MTATAPTRNRRTLALRRAVPCSALALLLVLPTLARADVDLTNAWVFSFSGPPAFVCDVDLVQTGTTLSGQGSCRGSSPHVTMSGTVDPPTGAFTLSATIWVPFGGTFGFVYGLLQGAPTGPSTLAGQATVNDDPGTFTASLCGNGVVDGGEACDDGAATNGCCTTSCTPKLDGISCSTTSACQIAPTCAAGVCSGTPKAAGTECEVDGNRCTDDACDAAGACVAGPCSPCCGGPNCTSQPRFSCPGPTDQKDLIDVQVSPFGAKDKLVWKIPHLAATSASDLPDPQTTDYAVCLYTLDSEDDFELYFDALAPASLGCGASRCWTESRNGTITYKGGKLRRDGVSSLRVKPGADGKAQISFLGQGPNLDATNPLQIGGGELLVELRAGAACWSALYVNLEQSGDIRTSTRYRKRGQDPFP